MYTIVVKFRQEFYRILRNKVSQYFGATEAAYFSSFPTYRQLYSPYTNYSETVNDIISVSFAVNVVRS
jgi:hypothetical protein